MMRAILSFDGAAWAQRHEQLDTYLDIVSGDPIVEIPVKENAAQGWKYGINVRTGARGWFPPGWAYGLKHPKYREWKAKKDREAACRHFAANDPVDLDAVHALELRYEGRVGADLPVLRR